MLFKTISSWYISVNSNHHLTSWEESYQWITPKPDLEGHWAKFLRVVRVIELNSLTKRASFHQRTAKVVRASNKKAYSNGNLNWAENKRHGCTMFGFPCHDRIHTSNKNLKHVDMSTSNWRNNEKTKHLKWSRGPTWWWWWSEPFIQCIQPFQLTIQAIRNPGFLL